MEISKLFKLAKVLVNRSTFTARFGILFFILFAVSESHAQRNEGFKFDWGFGYGFGGASTNTIEGEKLMAKGRAGIGLFIEPRYGLNDKWTVGLRLGTDILAAGNYKSDGESLDLDLSISGISSYLATGEYSFTTNRVRPFGGLGLGLYKGESINLNPDFNILIDDVDDLFVTKKTSSVGIMPRVGVNLGHFRMALAYNLPFKKELPKYLLFTIGIELGGGE